MAQYDQKSIKVLNSIILKFSHCNINVELNLFQSYGLRIFGMEFWINFYTSIEILKLFPLAYHNVIKKKLFILNKITISAKHQTI